MKRMGNRCEMKDRGWVMGLRLDGCCCTEFGRVRVLSAR